MPEVHWCLTLTCRQRKIGKEHHSFLPVLPHPSVYPTPQSYILWLSSSLICQCFTVKKNTKFAYKRTSYKAENAIGWGMRSKLSQTEDLTIKGRQVCTIKEASISEYESASQWPIPLPSSPLPSRLHCFPRKRGSSLFTHTGLATCFLSQSSTTLMTLTSNPFMQQVKSREVLAW